MGRRRQIIDNLQKREISVSSKEKDVNCLPKCFDGNPVFQLRGRAIETEFKVDRPATALTLAGNDYLGRLSAEFGDAWELGAKQKLQQLPLFLPQLASNGVHA